MDRIAMLRKDIMQGVGIEVLNSAYEILENEEDGDTEVRNKILLISSHAVLCSANQV